MEGCIKSHHKYLVSSSNWEREQEQWTCPQNLIWLTSGESRNNGLKARGWCIIQEASSGTSIGDHSININNRTRALLLLSHYHRLTNKKVTDRNELFLLELLTTEVPMVLVALTNWQWDLLLKTPYTQVLEHEEIKLVLTWELFLCAGSCYVFYQSRKLFINITKLWICKLQ